MVHVIEVAAPMHDIGKIGIPDSVLIKEGPLSPAELEIMRTHPRIGYDILKGSPSKYLSMGSIIALGPPREISTAPDIRTDCMATTFRSSLASSPLPMCSTRS